MADSFGLINSMPTSDSVSTKIFTTTTRLTTGWTTAFSKSVLGQGAVGALVFAWTTGSEYARNWAYGYAPSQFSYPLLTDGAFGGSISRDGVITVQMGTDGIIMQSSITGTYLICAIVHYSS